MTALPFPTFDAEPLCAEVDPDLMFPEQGGRSRPAKFLCHRCEIEEACREWAVSDPEMEGIWGGTTRDERRAIRAEREVASRKQADIKHGTEGGRRAHQRRGIPIPESDSCGCRAADTQARRRRTERGAA